MPHSSRPRASPGCGIFAAGTHISVPSPNASPLSRVVEDLRPGDSVVAASDGSAFDTVRHVTAHDSDGFGGAASSDFVQLTAHALGAGCPHRDIILRQDALLALTTPGEARRVLVPAGAIINGISITRQHSPAARKWYELTLQAQGIVLADDVPVATAFHPGRAPPIDPPTPRSRSPKRKATPPPQADALSLLMPGQQLLALRRRLSDIARTADAIADPTADPADPPAAWSSGSDMSNDTDQPVRLFIDGLPLLPEPDSLPLCLRFQLPAGAGPARLVSAASMSPAPDDTRRLGICVLGIEIDGQDIGLAAPALGPGFHGLEQDGATKWRWTNGAAWLVLPHVDIPRQLVFHVNDWHLRLQAPPAQSRFT